MKIALFLLIGCCVAAGHGKPEETCCGKHEKFNDCGTFWYCEPTCAKPEGSACPKICVAGCFCEPNFIRQRANGTCILKENCEKKC